MAMVKANAYGHGLAQVAPHIASQVNWFGVHTLEEAILLRRLRITKPVLVAAPIPVEQIPQAIKQQIAIAIPSLDYLKQVSKFPITIHLKINTGMNRLGLSPEEIPQAAKLIKNSRVKWQGIYTHFHSADLASAATKKQVAMFKKVVAEVKKNHPQILAHCANTAATLLHPASHMDMVRIGKGMYGYYPSIYVKSKTHLKLRPALQWKCQVVQVRKALKNETVGYAATHRFKADTLMAVLPVGYSDGYDRGLSNTGTVFIQGLPCPVVGRVSMNFMTVKLHAKVKTTSPLVAELIGKRVTASTIAKQLDTISYEVLARLSSPIPRILV